MFKGEKYVNPIMMSDGSPNGRFLSRNEESDIAKYLKLFDSFDQRAVEYLRFLNSCDQPSNI